MTPLSSLRKILTVGLLSTVFPNAVSRGGKVAGAPKLVYRQIGAGDTQALEAARPEKTLSVPSG